METNSSDGNQPSSTSGSAKDEGAGVAGSAALDRFARSFEASAKRWELVVYPSLFAFIILAAYGFFLIYSLTQDMHVLAKSIDPQMSQHMSQMSSHIATLSVSIELMSEDIERMTSEVEVMSTKLNALEPMLVNMSEMNRNMHAMAMNTGVMTMNTGAMTRNTSAMSRDMSQMGRPLSFMNFFTPW